MTVSQERLREVLYYNQETGEFRWKIMIGLRCNFNKPAGTINNKGYRIIFIDRKKYKASRLAWFYMTGNWPIEVDHKNLIKSDDSWNNLRDATSSQNKANVGLTANNTSGVKGVTRHHGRWQASIRLHGKGIHLGYFDDINDAGEAYKEAAKLLHGEFYRV